MAAQDPVRPVQTLKAAASESTEVEEREVKADDPNLSDELNANLTAELREVIGADTVVVPRRRPRFSEGEGQSPQSLFSYITIHRLQLMRATAIVLTFAAIVALATNKWWILPLAAGVHALGTMTVVMTTIRMVTITEHPAPAVAAALTEEGVSNADEFFSGMADEFRPTPSGSTGDVLSPDANERGADATTDPAQAGAEQSTAMTPTAQPSQDAGDGGIPDFINWSIPIGLLVVTFVIPPVSGDGWMWLLPLVTVPILGLWAYLQRLMAVRPERVRISRTGTLVGIALATTIAVAAFCAVLAIGLTTH